MSSPIVRRMLIGLLVLAFLLPMLWPLAQAQEATTQPAADQPATRPAVQVSSEAETLLGQVVDAYINLKTLRLAGKIEAAFDVQQEKDNQSVEFTAAYRAPNAFRHAIEGSVVAGSTGERAYVHNQRGNVYMNAAAPEGKVTTDQLPPPLGEVLNAENPSLVLAISGDPRLELTENVARIALGTPAAIDGKEHQTLHLALVNGPTMDLRIDPATHLIRQVLIDLKPSLERQGAVEVVQAQVTIDYTTSESGAELAADAFAWNPPDGARDIEEVRRLQAAPLDERIAAIKAREGKVAPDFKLTGLDGKEVALKDLKGSPVLLDFWAMWCAPCIVSMPQVEAIHREKGQRGLKVFAVNVGEEKSDVQPFVEQQGWQLPILLDPDTAVSVAYGADSGLPYQVLIDKEGKIRKVSLGIAGPMKEEMEKAIEEVLSE